MSKKRFTEEQVFALSKNPWVDRVSSLSVSFTEDFKRLVYEELLAGKPIWDIFDENGIDSGVLGPVRVMKFKQAIYDCAKSGEGFKLRRKLKRHQSTENAVNERIKSLEGEVAYLQQVIESLKTAQHANTGTPA
jgi:hypothetical protein